MATTSRLGNGQLLSDFFFKRVVTHEIGHNWGGRHDFERPGVCAYGVMSYEDTPLVTIILCDMWLIVLDFVIENSSCSASLMQWFSDCSRVDIGRTLSGVNCFRWWSGTWSVLIQYLGLCWYNHHALLFLYSWMECLSTAMDLTNNQSVINK